MNSAVCSKQAGRAGQAMNPLSANTTLACDLIRKFTFSNEACHCLESERQTHRGVGGKIVSRGEVGIYIQTLKTE